MTILCRTCRTNPAGFGTWYANSAYCADCQPDVDMAQIKPRGKSDAVWLEFLTLRRAEVAEHRNYAR